MFWALEEQASKIHSPNLPPQLIVTAQINARGDLATSLVPRMHRATGG